MSREMKFSPMVGLIVYKGEKDHHYVETHEIISQDGKYIWGAAKPFRKEQLQGLATALGEEQISSLKVKGLFPDTVLYFQPQITGAVFIWYKKPQAYYLNFTDAGIRPGKYHFPGLIMAVKGKDIYTFAFKGLDRPTAKTDLYHAPLFNIYNSGEVCMGTISESRRKIWLDEEIDRWERRFFGGRFTSAHEPELAKGIEVKSLYKQMKRAFPEEALKKTRFKLGNILTKIGGHND